MFHLFKEVLILYRCISLFTVASFFIFIELGIQVLTVHFSLAFRLNIIGNPSSVALLPPFYRYFPGKCVYASWFNWSHELLTLSVKINSHFQMFGSMKNKAFESWILTTFKFPARCFICSVEVDDLERLDWENPLL